MKKPFITQIQGILVAFGVLMIVSSDLRIHTDRPKEEFYLKLLELIISEFPKTDFSLLN